MRHLVFEEDFDREVEILLPPWPPVFDRLERDSSDGKDHHDLQRLHAVLITVYSTTAVPQSVTQLCKVALLVEDACQRFSSLDVHLDAPNRVAWLNHYGN